MNLEKLLNRCWSDFSVPLTLDCEEYCEESCSNPEPFWEELFSLHQKSRRTPLQSVRADHYDFYHDCIVRHLLSNDLAYTFIEKGENKGWTYKQLHRCVNFHVRKWSQQDLKAGQIIAIVLLPGSEFLIALLTALRLGLTFCFLPPTSILGKGQITSILSKLEPQFIVSADDFELKEVPRLLIDPKGLDEENHAPLSFSYKASTPIQIALSLYRQEPLAFVPLDAHTLYLHSLRDAYITLNLIENNSWASPLSCPIRTEPCSTLSTLLAGARKVHVSDDSLKSDPQILKDEKIQLLGISGPLQQLWSRTPAAPIRSLKACYKAPFDFNYQAWKSFLKLNTLEKTATFNILMDSSMGGITLFSQPSLDSFDFRLKPALGTPWTLENPVGESSQTAFRVYGVFTPQLSCSENSEVEGNRIFLQAEKGLTIAHTAFPCRDAVTFPQEPLERIVHSLPFVEACVLHAVQKPNPPGDYFFVLLVFVNPMQPTLSEAEKKEWDSDIARHIVDQLGAAFLPDQIEYYPLLPPLRSNGIDRNWCGRQYSEGLLARKMQIPAYQLLHTLKKLAAGHKMEDLT